MVLASASTYFVVVKPATNVPSIIVSTIRKSPGLTAPLPSRSS